jgi:HEAT repeat protein
VTDSSGFSGRGPEQLEKKPHRVVRLVDTDGDGRFDRSTVFADRMMFPEGAMWSDGSLYVAAPPSIWKLTDTAGARDEARALELLGDALTEACRAAVQSSAEQARTVANLLLSRGGAPAFGELTAHVEELPSAERARAEATAERIARAVVGPFVALAGHPAAGLRSTAIEFLGTRDEAEAREALVRALLDEDTQVQRAAMMALEARPHLDTLSGVSALLDSKQPWATRLGAAKALAAYAALGEAARSTESFRRGLDRLLERALQDDNAFVREAALRSSFRLSRELSLPVARRVVESDEEPRVVDVARKLLEAGTDGAVPGP